MKPNTAMPSIQPITISPSNYIITSSNSSGNDVGGIIGGVFGGIAGLLFLLIILYYIRKKFLIPIYVKLPPTASTESVPMNEEYSSL